MIDQLGAQSELELLLSRDQPLSLEYNVNWLLCVSQEDYESDYSQYSRYQQHRLSGMIGEMSMVSRYSKIFSLDRSSNHYLFLYRMCDHQYPPSVLPSRDRGPPINCSVLAVCVSEFT